MSWAHGIVEILAVNTTRRHTPNGDDMIFYISYSHISGVLDFNVWYELDEDGNVGLKDTSLAP